MKSFFSNLLRDRRTKPCSTFFCRSFRVSCGERAEFLDRHGNCWSCTIRDMSATGLGISTEAPIKPGDRISLVHPCLDAKVVHVTGNRAGLRISRQ